MSLIDVCTENRPAADGTLSVPISEVAHRVIGYYWSQPHTLGDTTLKQMSGAGRTIPSEVAVLRSKLGDASYKTAESAREAEIVEYERLVRWVALRLAQMPIAHLQNLAHDGSTTSAPFIFGAAPFSPEMSRREFELHPDILLLQGVPDAFKQTASLLRAVIRQVWTAEVRKMNAAILADDDDLEHALFGVDRSSLLAVRRPLVELQAGRCFYCDGAMRAVEIDHVLPFSRVPINGVANLVAADRDCNNRKRDTLPILDHVQRAVGRSGVDLRGVAVAAGLPILLKRVFPDRERPGRTG